QKCPVWVPPLVLIIKPSAAPVEHVPEVAFCGIFIVTVLPLVALFRFNAVSQPLPMLMASSVAAPAVIPAMLIPYCVTPETRLLVPVILMPASWYPEAALVKPELSMLI